MQHRSCLNRFAAIIVLCMVVTVLAATAQVGAMVTAPKIGVAAPGFALNDLDGKLVRLTGFAGRPVLLAFWSPLCSICRVSLPELNRVYPDWVKEFNLEVLAIDVRGVEYDTRKFAAESGLAFPVLVGNSTVAARYAITGVPAYFLVDAKGIIRYTQVGSSSMADLRLNIIDALKDGV